MKKILSLLTAITLTASGTSSLVSCGTNQKKSLTNQQKINLIKNKINNQNLTILNEGKKHADYSVLQFKNEIKKAITSKVANSSITSSSYTITFSNNTLLLNATTEQSIQVTINLGGLTQIVTTKLKLDFTKNSILQKINSLSQQNKILAIQYDVKKLTKTFAEYKDNVKKELMSKLNLKSNKFTITSTNPQYLDVAPATLNINIGDGVGTVVQVDNILKWRELLLDNSDKLKAIPSDANIKGNYNFNNKIYLYTNKGLYSAVNNTSNYTLVSSGTLTAAKNITAIKSNSNYLYIGTNSGDLYRIDKTSTTFEQVSYTNDNPTKINTIYLGQDSASINTVVIGTNGNGVFIAAGSSKPTQISDFKKSNIATNVYSITSKSINNYTIGADNGVYDLAYDTSTSTINPVKNTKIASREVDNISYIKSKDLTSSGDLYVYSQKDENDKYNIYILTASASLPSKITIEGGATDLGSKIINWNYFPLFETLFAITANNKVYDVPTTSTGREVEPSPNGYFGIPLDAKIVNLNLKISQSQPGQRPLMNAYVNTSKKLYIG